MEMVAQSARMNGEVHKTNGLRNFFELAGSWEAMGLPPYMRGVRLEGGQLIIHEDHSGGTVWPRFWPSLR